jgi:hypothetical protein
MALSFLYLMTRRLLGILLGRFQSEHAKDVEIAVLRHQLGVLRPWDAQSRTWPLSCQLPQPSRGRVTPPLTPSRRLPACYRSLAT